MISARLSQIATTIRVVAERLVYEWDENKRRTNRAKHGVDFAAMRAFDWETARIEADDHPEEPRWVGRGVIGSRLHVVVFTERGNRIRVISLRKANPREEQRHARQCRP